MKAYTLLSSYAMAASILHDRVHAQNTPGVRALVKADRDLKDNVGATHGPSGSSMKASHGKGNGGKGGTKSPGGGSSRKKSLGKGMGEGKGGGSGSGLRCKEVHRQCRSSHECCRGMQCVGEWGHKECAFETVEEPGWVTCPAGLAFEKLEGQPDAMLLMNITDKESFTQSVEWPSPPVNWFGRSLPLTFRVSTKGQINMDPTDFNDNCCSADAIGTYGRPRIAIAHGDLDPSRGGDIRALAMMGPDSITVSFEKNVELFDYYGETSNAFINAQAKIFANGNVNLCFGNGTLAEERTVDNEFGNDTVAVLFNQSVAIGIENPQTNNSFPLPGLESTNGVTDSWDVVRNQCFCFVMPQQPPPPPSVVRDCFNDHRLLGCSNAGCESVVCEVDSYCCDTSWDTWCAAKAESDLCVGIPINSTRPVEQPTPVPPPPSTAEPPVEQSGWMDFCPDPNLAFKKLEGQPDAMLLNNITDNEFFTQSFFTQSVKWPSPPVNWFGRVLPATLRVSTKGQINMDPTDFDPNCCSADAIGNYGGPRIAIAHGDLDPSTGGDIRTLAMMTNESITVSFENNVEFYYGDGNFFNAQAEIFPSGNINLCFGNGTLAEEDVAIGIEDPLTNSFFPLPGLESTNGVTNSWDIVRNKCFCFAMPQQPPPSRDCCVDNNAPGCSNDECESAVCMTDPYCCDVAWDYLCAAKAATDSCTDFCPTLTYPTPF